MNIRQIIPVAVITLLCACGGNTNNQPTTDSTYASTTLNDTSGPSNSQMSTLASDSVGPASQLFVMNAIANSNLQINAAKQAMQHSSNEAVRNLAKTISDQNTELQNKLNDVIKTQNIQLTGNRTPEMADDFANLSGKTGQDFDRLYLKNMVEGYEKNIEMYKQAVSALQNGQIRQYASTAIPILQQHLDAARAIK